MVNMMHALLAGRAHAWPEYPIRLDQTGGQGDRQQKQHEAHR
jgi:hypothetical protein